MKIILVGGGTLGSVSPLIALTEELKKKDLRLDILWVGTKNGVEAEFVDFYNIRFAAIHAGKLRRYASFANLSDAWKILAGFLQSIYIIASFKPHLIIGAGSYLQVPIMYAAGIFFKKIKIIIHQQDIKKGLANSLCARFAHTITVSARESLSLFPKEKTVYVGNPYRKDIVKGIASKAYTLWKLNKNAPVVLVLGGGTGASSLNELVLGSVKEISRICQMIHITGKGKKISVPSSLEIKNYRQVEFLKENLSHAYAIADVVVSRAGFSTLTELSILSKPAILIPLPDTHQEDNAYFFEKEDAACVLDQRKTSPALLAQKIEELIGNNGLRFELSTNISKIMPRNANELFLEEITKLLDQEITIKKW